MIMRSSDFHDLLVWKKSMELTAEIYRLAKLLPKEETYALSDQMRRAAVSIPSNIAEDRGRNSDKDSIRFLSVSRGSLWELSTQLDICVMLNYLTESQIQNAKALIDEISKMMSALGRSLS